MVDKRVKVKGKKSDVKKIITVETRKIERKKERKEGERREV